MSGFDDARADVARLEVLGRRARYDELNRLALLLVHAIGGLAFGACFIVFGVPASWQTGWSSTDPAQAIATAVPILGGATLAGGLLCGRHLVAEAVGMLVLLGWEAAGVVVVVRWIKIAHPGPLQYQVVLYALPAVLMTIHMVTLTRYLREEHR